MEAEVKNVQWKSIVGAEGTGLLFSGVHANPVHSVCRLLSVGFFSLGRRTEGPSGASAGA